MPPWALWDYVATDGSTPYRVWYEAQEPEVQAALDAAVMNLRATEDWVKPKLKIFKELVHKHAGLAEIRFWPFGPNRKFRVTGLYRPELREFIFLTGCEKRLGKYYPSDAFDVALAYRAELEAGEGTRVEHI